MIQMRLGVTRSTGSLDGRVPMRTSWTLATCVASSSSSSSSSSSASTHAESSSGSRLTLVSTTTHERVVGEGCGGAPKRSRTRPSSTIDDTDMVMEAEEKEGTKKRVRIKATGRIPRPRTTSKTLGAHRAPRTRSPRSPRSPSSTAAHSLVADMTHSEWDVLIDMEIDMTPDAEHIGSGVTLPFDDFLPDVIPPDYGLSFYLSRLSSGDRLIYERDVASAVTPERLFERRRQVQGSTKWKQDRALGIGASEALYFLGLHTWQSFASALCGKTEMVEFKPGIAAQRGTQSEHVGLEKVRYVHAVKIAEQVDRVMTEFTIRHPGYWESLQEGPEEPRPPYPPNPEALDFGLVSIASVSSSLDLEEVPVVKWYGFKCPIPKWIQQRWARSSFAKDEWEGYGESNAFTAAEPSKGSMPDLLFPYILASSDRGLVLFLLYLATGLEIKFGGRDEPYVFGKVEHFVQIQQTMRVHRYPMMLYCPCSTKQFQTIPHWNDRPIQEAIYYILTQRYFTYLFPAYLQYQAALQTHPHLFAPPTTMTTTSPPPTTPLSKSSHSSSGKKSDSVHHHTTIPTRHKPKTKAWFKRPSLVDASAKKRVMTHVTLRWHTAARLAWRRPIGPIESL